MSKKLFVEQVKKSGNFPCISIPTNISSNYIFVLNISRLKLYLEGKNPPFNNLF